MMIINPLLKPFDYFFKVFRYFLHSTCLYGTLDCVGGKGQIGRDLFIDLVSNTFIYFAVANSGGVLGVFTGFSFLALCELVYFLTLRLWTTIKHTWQSGLHKSSEKAFKHDQLKCCFCCGPVLVD